MKLPAPFFLAALLSPFAAFAQDYPSRIVRVVVPWPGGNRIVMYERDQRSLLTYGPKGNWLLTYSQSENKSSKHKSDQTEQFSNSKFIPMLYTNAGRRGVVAAALGV